jgi:hypothetical protein
VVAATHAAADVPWVAPDAAVAVAAADAQWVAVDAAAVDAAAAGKNEYTYLEDREDLIPSERPGARSHAGSLCEVPLNPYRTVFPEGSNTSSFYQIRGLHLSEVSFVLSSADRNCPQCFV